MGGLGAGLVAANTLLAPTCGVENPSPIKCLLRLLRDGGLRLAEVGWAWASSWRKGAGRWGGPFLGRSTGCRGQSWGQVVVKGPGEGGKGPWEQPVASVLCCGRWDLCSGRRRRRTLRAWAQRGEASLASRAQQTTRSASSVSAFAPRACLGGCLKSSGLLERAGHNWP